MEHSEEQAAASGRQAFRGSVRAVLVGLALAACAEGVLRLAGLPAEYAVGCQLIGLGMVFGGCMTR